MKTSGEYCADWSPQHPAFHQVMQLDQQLMQHPWSQSEWESGTQDQTVFLWCRGDELRGFALYRVSRLERLAHLLKIAVIPAARGTGEAESFWQQQLPTLRSFGCERVYLEVAAQNKVARNFYSRLGFKMLHEVKGFYHDGQSAITMELVI